MSAIAWDWIADHDAEIRRVVINMRIYGHYDPEDALHDAYIYLAARLDPAKNPRTYVISKVRNLVIDEWRKHGRRRDELNDLPTSDEVDDMAIATVLFEQACDVIAELPEGQRLIMWHRIQGRTQAEIAQLTGMPIGTVKTRTRMALQTLAA